jgi:hypothetical protein
VGGGGPEILLRDSERVEWLRTRNNFGDGTQAGRRWLLLPPLTKSAPQQSALAVLLLQP